MAGNITKIQVSACDNELYILASQSPVGSTELCHIKSGFNDPVNLLIDPRILPHGSYTLIMVGINWGGPQAFSVTLTDAGGVVTNHAIGPAPAPVGATWTVAVPITV
jgi:hypothetical protein